MKNYVTIKKTFSRFGLIHLQDGIRLSTSLTDDEVFAYLMNWIVNDLRQLKVTIPTLISTDVNFTFYKWTENDTFNEMTSEKISASVQRAETTNNLQSGAQAEEYENMAWVLNEPCSSLTAEDYQAFEEILDV